MPNEKAEALRRLSDDDLAKELEETHRRLFTLRMQIVTQQLTNHRELVEVRRQIARIKTAQRERGLARTMVVGSREGRAEG